MKIAILTDTWKPYISGVVRTYTEIEKILIKWEHDVFVIHNHFFAVLPTPTYPELKIAIIPYFKLKYLLDEYKPDAIHIGTEGSIGIAGRNYCKSNNIPFTTAFHTLLPEYVNMRVPLFDITKWGYNYIRWFHEHSHKIFVPSNSIKQKLIDENIGNKKNIIIWEHGIDKIFKPTIGNFRYNSPILLYVGRVAVEKSIEDFLDIKIDGTKVVVGDGPDLEKLKSKYKNVIFTGFLTGKELLSHYSMADVFVFPSKTDTFGNVILEANACGTPVAAYPVSGPIDLIKNGINGWLDNDLKIAINNAMQVKRKSCIDFSKGFTWEKAAQIFVENLKIIKG